MSLVPRPVSPQGHLLTTANGAAIATDPERSLILHLKDNWSVLHQVKFDFITGYVEGPILGIDFLRKFKITMDLATDCVCCCNGTIFLGILYLSLSNKVFAALPVDI